MLLQKGKVHLKLVKTKEPCYYKGLGFALNLKHPVKLIWRPSIRKSIWRFLLPRTGEYSSSSGTIKNGQDS
ncbi:hypothetical protein L1987_84977 [Smallanthus sonchifolius]|uniref:Uncharacterized protein n=1 Tax=Smallanthus sonchifolius TaxID=185202 RepID=A0ACB8XV46_9ASTR|nr:hypothetical protein L1987_84977 [Smallanthus sonchifolius]